MFNDCCGCYHVPDEGPHRGRAEYLPQVSLNAHATVVSSAASTILTQNFVNPSTEILKQVSYIFPLYDSVSVVGFECKVGDRLLHSKVKSAKQADKDYKEAVANEQTAAIMDHTSQNDVFLIRLGNVPAHKTITVDITFVGELKQDTQTDGIRYTIPSAIAPRYGNQIEWELTHMSPLEQPAVSQGMSLVVDVQLERDLILRELQSPSHQIKVSLGRTSHTQASTFKPSCASATLSSRNTAKEVFLDRDFVLLINADGLDTPRALVEIHPTIKNQRALMATLVPKFALPPITPEVVFVIDRSASMCDKITMVQSALKVFLKSLPVGACFNICSFGNQFSFMWPKSKVYDASSLNQALEFVDTICANMGGTNMEPAVIGTVGNRLEGKNLEVLILTDGQIYNQSSLFDFVRTAAANNTARFFSLGVGDAASHSLIEGIARAGNGICQSVMEYEELDRKVVRMLKAALTPHIYDYKLEVEYEDHPQEEHGFDIVSDAEIQGEYSATEEGDSNKPSVDPQPDSSHKPILLFDENFTEPDILQVGADASSSAEIPTLTLPKEIQAPNKIPTLYPFVRTSVYLLMDADKAEHNPKTLKLSATSKYGPLQLNIPIQSIGSGEIIHQLACRKAVIELEEEHGWLSEAKDDSGNSFQQFHLETKQRIVERECQRLGIKFQVTGKHCSFVALEEDLGKQDKTDSPGNSSNQSSPGRTSGITVTFTGLKEHSVQHLLPSSFTSFSGGARFMDTRPDTKYVHPHRQVDYALSNTFGRNSSHACRTNPFATQSQFGVAQSHGAERKEIIIGGGSLFGVAANAPPPQSQFGVTQSRGGEKKRRKGDSFFGVAVNRLPLQSQFGEAQIREGQKGGGGLFGAPRGSPFSTQSPFGVARSGGRDVGGSSLFGASDKASSPQDSFEERPTLSSLRPQAQFQMACFAPGRADPAGGVKGPRGQAMPPAKPPADTIHELIELQNFDGSWTWSKKLFTVLGLHEEETTRTIVRMCDQHMNTDAAKFPNGDEKTVIATLLAIGYLENKYLKSRSVWELLHAKADAWVTQKLHQMGDPFLGDTCSQIRSMA